MLFSAFWQNNNIAILPVYWHVILLQACCEYTLFINIRFLRVYSPRVLPACTAKLCLDWLLACLQVAAAICSRMQKNVILQQMPLNLTSVRSNQLSDPGYHYRFFTFTFGRNGPQKWNLHAQISLQYQTFHVV